MLSRKELQRGSALSWGLNKGKEKVHWSPCFLDVGTAWEAESTEFMGGYLGVGPGKVAISQRTDGKMRARIHRHPSGEAKTRQK